MRGELLSIFYVEDRTLYFVIALEKERAFQFKQNPIKETLYHVAPKGKIKLYTLTEQYGGNLFFAYDIRNNISFPFLDGSRIVSNNTDYEVVIEYFDDSTNDIKHFAIAPRQRTIRRVINKTI